MTRLFVNVENNNLTTRLDGRLLTGMVGVPVRFSFLENMDGYHVIVAFRCNGMERCALLNDNMETTIPWEVLKNTGDLYIGFEKRNVDGSVVIPTSWTYVEKVCEGVNGAALAGKEATACVYDKILNLVENPPVCGVDYWTEADKQQIVAEVISKLPVYRGEVL